MTEILDLAGLRALRHGVGSPDLGRVALVPTMGALHDGHLALVNLAQQHADTVIVSIFVNPLQFGPTEDLDRYPRPFADDLAKLEAAGVQYVFHPTVEEMYPNWPATTTVSAGEAGTILEGVTRPGHFDGVLTVVAKLLTLAAPDLAVFGEKDAQQLALVRRMVRELHFPLEIVGQPIVREPDGLALSSRNAFLEGDDRQRALTLSRALRAAEAAASAGPAAAKQAGLAVYAAEPLASMDYLELVDPDTFAPVADDYRGEVLALTAARVGPTRLIDNRSFRVG
ncbi:pantoate--beta-alanine ligase [Gulosibacter massiliensis]|uniref:pantoate--beta-alanine ligase n=1 Tax=Gulosibacter massiliensis TaxID=2479839 RepID=UPI000F63D886|nr:pantoate--beta-alanine ligase [Gulosibacter massiliensis]